MLLDGDAGPLTETRPSSSASWTATPTACCASPATCCSSPAPRPAASTSTWPTATSPPSCAPPPRARAPRRRRRRIALESAAADAALVRGHRARLGQMLDNLVSTAVKFTPAGGRVTLAVDTGPDVVTVE